MTTRFIVNYLHHESSTVNIIYHFCLGNRARHSFRQTIITRTIWAHDWHCMCLFGYHLSHTGICLQQ